MRLVRLSPIAESCMCDISLLPHHTFNYCPMEDARSIVSHYINNVDRLVRDRSSSTTTEGLVALLKDQATVDLKKVNLFVNSFYDDGRVCPYGQFSYVLKTMYERGLRFLNASALQQVVECGLVTLDYSDYGLLAKRSLN